MFKKAGHPAKKRRMVAATVPSIKAAAAAAVDQSRKRQKKRSKPMGDDEEENDYWEGEDEESESLNAREAAQYRSGINFATKASLIECGLEREVFCSGARDYSLFVFQQLNKKEKPSEDVKFGTFDKTEFLHDDGRDFGNGARLQIINGKVSIKIGRYVCFWPLTPCVNVAFAFAFFFWPLIPFPHVLCFFFQFLSH